MTPPTPTEVSDKAAGQTIAATLVASIFSILPVVLLGGVAVLVRRDLGFSETRLGLLLAMFYGATALTAVYGGALAERIGGLRAVGFAILLNVVSLIAIASLATRWWHLAVLLATAGFANAVIQPASNLALARWVPARRQGFAFGVKQANGPMATMLAGAAAALIATRFGWRWAFALAALGGLGFFALRPRDWRIEPRRLVRDGDQPDASFGPMLIVAVGCGLAAAVGTSLTGFYVESAVADGYGIAGAGWLLVTGSAVGIFARVGWGRVIDRSLISGFAMTALLMIGGGGGYVLIGLSTGSVLLITGTVIAFGLGWAWTGIAFFAAVQASPASPGKASGMVMAGVSAGGIFGPPLFGRVVETWGYPAAWRSGAVVLVLGAGVVLVGDAVIKRTGLVADSAPPFL